MSLENVTDKQHWIYRLAILLMILNEGGDDAHSGNESESSLVKLSFVNENDEQSLKFSIVTKKQKCTENVSKILN